MATIEMQITGMSCSGCAHSIERALHSMPGIESVVVQLSTGNATIIYDEASTSPEEMATTLKALGFGVQH